MLNIPNVCEGLCKHNLKSLETRMIVLTGGPGAGKTAVLEMAKKVLCHHVVILPEAASIIFGGGFWRMNSSSARMAAQRAILHVQIELENLVIEEKKWAVGLCDRGTLDGLAYWPNGEENFWETTHSQLKTEYAKYFGVIHLRSPTDLLGYNQQNTLRIETALQSKEIDDKIALAWSKHPNYHVIENSEDFLTKAHSAIALISEMIPEFSRVNLNLNFKS
ncbi:MAG: AAA family ATPase [Bdellovibrionaceae bacterium]|nr:AAA family ATPase [Pseudobdellovibrionaceae bacterium]